MLKFIVYQQQRKLATIVAILKSRRLLSDHSEILEECLSNDYNDSKKPTLDKYFNATNCSLLITSSILTSKFVSKRYVFDQSLIVVRIQKNFLSINRIGVTLCAISGGYAIMCLTKMIFHGQLWMLHKSIAVLLDDIDEFDACMRRSISYFRENAYFQSSHQSSPDQM